MAVNPYGVNPVWNDSTDKQRAIFFSILSAAFFSIQFPIIKVALNTINSAQAAVLEALFTVALCWVVSLFTKKPVTIQEPRVMVLAGLLNALGLIFLFESLALINPATVGFIGRLYFVYTSVLSLIYFKEWPTPLETFAIPGTILGLFLFSFRDFDTTEVMGVVMGSLYPLCFAAQNAVIKRRVELEDMNSVLLHNKIWALLFLTIYAISKHGLSTLRMEPTGVGLVFLSTFFATFLGLLLFYRALRSTKFSLANIVKGSEIFFILGFSYLFFPIHLTPVNLVGGAIVFFCILLLMWEQSRGRVAQA